MILPESWSDSYVDISKLAMPNSMFQVPPRPVVEPRHPKHPPGNEWYPSLSCTASCPDASIHLDTACGLYCISSTTHLQYSCYT